MNYDGAARIDGVPGSAAPIPIDFLDVAGSSCGALFPTGNMRDVINGVELTCVDNGMPVVIMRARDFSKTGYIDSSGLGVLVSLSKKIREQGGELRLAGLNADLQTLFELTKLDTLFAITRTAEEALAAF